MFLVFLGCKSYPELETVKEVDLKRYVGKWYEIASFPQSFQAGCNCSTAEYKLTNDDYIEVINTCRKNSPTGEVKQVSGKAFIDDEVSKSKLKVQFFWPFRGKYWIIELADDYSYAVVGHPNRDYLWILNRTPKMNPETYAMLLNRLTAKGFDVKRLSMTVQTCNN